MTISEACRLVVDLIRQLSEAYRELDAALAELAATRAERDAYREIVSVAMTQLYEKNRERARERASYYRLLDDYRALRGQGRKVPPAA